MRADRSFLMLRFLWGPKVLTELCTRRGARVPSVSLPPHLLLCVSKWNDNFNDACSLEKGIYWLLKRRKMSNRIYFLPTQTGKVPLCSTFYRLRPTCMWILNSTFGLKLWRCVRSCAHFQCMWLILIILWMENKKVNPAVLPRGCPPPSIPEQIPVICW